MYHVQRAIQGERGGVEVYRGEAILREAALEKWSAEHSTLASEAAGRIEGEIQRLAEDVKASSETRRAHEALFNAQSPVPHRRQDATHSHVPTAHSYNYYQ